MHVSAGRAFFSLYWSRNLALFLPRINSNSGSCRRSIEPLRNHPSSLEKLKTEEIQFESLMHVLPLDNVKLLGSCRRDGCLGAGRRGGSKSGGLVPECDGVPI